jgi:hypothetical protein
MRAEVASRMATGTDKHKRKRRRKKKQGEEKRRWSYKEGQAEVEEPKRVE